METLQPTLIFATLILFLFILEPYHLLHCLCQDIHRQTEVFDLALALCLEADTNNKSVESFLKHSHRIKYNISYTSHLRVNNVLLTS